MSQFTGWQQARTQFCNSVEECTKSSNVILWQVGNCIHQLEHACIGNYFQDCVINLQGGQWIFPSFSVIQSSAEQLTLGPSFWADSCHCDLLAMGKWRLRCLASNPSHGWEYSPCASSGLLVSWPLGHRVFSLFLSELWTTTSFVKDSSLNWWVACPRCNASSTCLNVLLQTAVHPIH